MAQVLENLGPASLDNNYEGWRGWEEEYASSKVPTASVVSYFPTALNHALITQFFHLSLTDTIRLVVVILCQAHVIAKLEDR